MDKTDRSLANRSVAELELSKAKNAIEQFIYSCSHTLRGPLKSIAGLVNLLKNAHEKHDVDPHNYLQCIESTVAKMESVLTDLEKFLETTSQSIVTKPVDAKDFINQILDDFRGAIEENDIDVVIRATQTSPLYTDENRLRVVITHLISNAILYHDRKKKKKRIDILVNVNSSTCTLQVRDNGIGMSSETKSKLFQLFYRGSAVSTGAGVGLYISREVLTKMKGKISVTSMISKGSCFSLSIPNLSVQ